MKKKLNKCPDGWTKFAMTHSYIVSTVNNSAAGTPTEQMTTAGAAGRTDKMDQMRGNRNSSDVDTSRPDQAPTPGRHGVCEVCIVLLLYIFTFSLKFLYSYVVDY